MIVGKGNGNLQGPRLIFSRVIYFATVMLGQTLVKIIGNANIIVLGKRNALKDIHGMGWHAKPKLGVRLPRRFASGHLARQRRNDVASCPLLGQDYRVTALPG